MTISYNLLTQTVSFEFTAADVKDISADVRAQIVAAFLDMVAS